MGGSNDDSLDREQPIDRSWCRVEANERVAEDTHWLELEAPAIARRAAPGQFVMIGFGVHGWGRPFLPRPNSVAAVRGDRIGLLIRAFGEGSRRLTTLQTGDSALVLGPLGRSYDLGAARDILCVAGGVGLAPFILLPRWAAGRAPGTRVRLLYGERTGSAVFDPTKLGQFAGIEAEVWTEDGSLGRAGLVTDGIKLDGVDLLLACGPTPMLKAVRRLALAASVPCQIAVEEHMACGVGTCFGCVIPTIDPDSGAEDYALVCIEGPVFRGEHLRW